MRLNIKLSQQFVFNSNFYKIKKSPSYNPCSGKNRSL